MVIPFTILHNMRLAMRQQLILSLLFSLAMVTIAVAAVRGVLVLRSVVPVLRTRGHVFTPQNAMELKEVVFLTNVCANMGM
jgi:hypothetical protein